VPRKGLALFALVVVLLAALPVLAQDAALPLPETFTSQDAMLRLNYPTGWIAQDTNTPGSVIVASSDQFGYPQINFGQVAGLFFVYPASDLGTMNPALEVSDGMQPIEIVTGVVASANPGLQASEPISFTSAGHPAARATIIGGDNDTEIIIVALADDLILDVQILAAPGQLPDFEATILAIIESIAYSPVSAPETAAVLQSTVGPTAPPQAAQPPATEEPVSAGFGEAAESPTEAPVASEGLALTETFTTNDGALAFDYPAGWVAENYSGLIFLGNSAEAARPDTPVTAGQFQMYFALIDLQSALGDAATNDPAVDLPEFLRLFTGNVPMAEPTRLTIAGFPAASVDIAGRLDDHRIFIAVGENVVVSIVVVAPEGELDDYESTWRPIVEGIRYNPVTTAAQPDVQTEPQIEVSATPAVAVEPQVEVDTTPAVADEALELSQTFTAANGSFRLRHPEGWMVEESEGLIAITNSADPTIEQLNPGERVLLLKVGSLTEMGRVPADLSALTILNRFADSTQIGVPYEEAETLTIGGWSSARANAFTMMFDHSSILMRLEGETEGYIAYVHAFTTIDELEEFEPTLLAILASITIAPFDEPTTIPATAAVEVDSTAEAAVVEIVPTVVPTVAAVTEGTYTAADGSFTFHHPATWQVGENADGTIVLVGPQQTMALLELYPLSDVEAVDTDATPLDVLQARLEGQDIPRVEPITFTISGLADERQAASEDVMTAQADATTIIMFVDTNAAGDEPVMVGEMSVFTGPNTLRFIRAELLDILASLEVAAP